MNNFEIYFYLKFGYFDLYYNHNAMLSDVLLYEYESNYRLYYTRNVKEEKKSKSAYIRI